MKLTKSTSFISTAAACFVIILFIEPNSVLSLSNELFNYENSVIEPLFFTLLGILVSNFILLFTKDKSFYFWLKYILSWFLPLSLIVIATGTNGAQFGWVTKTYLAQVMGGLLVLITFVYVIVRVFMFKTSKK